MAEVVVVTWIGAPVERCFDLARSIDLHVESLGDTGERAVAGVTSGLIGPDEEVTWEGRHFGVRQRFTSRITGYRRPDWFQDSMVRGAFTSFVHDHFFEPVANGTQMRDCVRFRSAFALVGVDRLLLSGYLRRLLQRRNAVIKGAAEGTGSRAAGH